MTKRTKETGGRGWIGEPNVKRSKLKRKRKPVTETLNQITCNKCHFYGNRFHGDPWIIIEDLEGKKPDRLICPSCGHVNFRKDNNEKAKMS